MHLVGISGGNIAKRASGFVLVAIVHTSPGLRSVKPVSRPPGGNLDRVEAEVVRLGPGCGGRGVRSAWSLTPHLMAAEIPDRAEEHAHPYEWRKGIDPSHTALLYPGSHSAHLLPSKGTLQTAGGDCRDDNHHQLAEIEADVSYTTEQSP